MKTFELISHLICGLVALGLFIVGMVADGCSWVLDQVGEYCQRAAERLLK